MINLSFYSMVLTPILTPHRTVPVSLVILLLMIYVDYATGHEFMFSAAYLLPVALCAWHLGSWSVWLMALAGGLATGVMGAVEGHVYSHFMFHYWSSFSCFLILLITGLLLHRIKLTLRERSKMNDDLRQAFEDLKASTEEIRKLQEGLQVVCAWTKQIKVDDQWMAPDEFLINKLHLHLTHGMSPDACRGIQQELQALDRKR